MRSLIEFGLEVGKLAAAHPAPGRIAALGHEAGDDAVEHDAVVKAFLGEVGDPLDMAGCEIRTQLDDDVAAGRKGEGQFIGIGHRLVLGR